MTNNIRVFLWLGLGLALWLNYSQWKLDYDPKPSAVAAATGAPGAAMPASMEDTVPQAPQSAAPAPVSAADAVPTAPTADGAPVATGPVESAGVIHVSTDVLELDIDLKGGTLVRAA